MSKTPQVTANPKRPPRKEKWEKALDREWLHKLAVLQGQLSCAQRNIYELMPRVGEREVAEMATGTNVRAGELMFMSSMQVMQLQYLVNDLSNQIRDELGEKRVEPNETMEQLKAVWDEKAAEAQQIVEKIKASRKC